MTLCNFFNQSSVVLLCVFYMYTFFKFCFPADYRFKSTLKVFGCASTLGIHPLMGLPVLEPISTLMHTTCGIDNFPSHRPYAQKLYAVMGF